MPPHIQKRVRIVLSSMAVLMLAPLTIAFAVLGFQAIPRDRCGALQQGLCSDYGRVYLAFALVCLLMLYVALRLINRGPRVSGSDGDGHADA